MINGLLLYCIVFSTYFFTYIFENYFKHFSHVSMWGVITVDMVLGALDNRARGSVATHTAMIPKAGWNHLQSFVFFLLSHFLITKNASSASPFYHYKNPLSVHLEDRKQERI